MAIVLKEFWTNRKKFGYNSSDLETVGIFVEQTEKGTTTRVVELGTTKSSFIILSFLKDCEFCKDKNEVLFQESDTEEGKGIPPCFVLLVLPLCEVVFKKYTRRRIHIRFEDGFFSYFRFKGNPENPESSWAKWRKFIVNNATPTEATSEILDDNRIKIVHIKEIIRQRKSFLIDSPPSNSLLSEDKKVLDEYESQSNQPPSVAVDNQAVAGKLSCSFIPETESILRNNIYREESLSQERFNDIQIEFSQKLREEMEVPSAESCYFSLSCEDNAHMLNDGEKLVSNTDPLNKKSEDSNNVRSGSMHFIHKQAIKPSRIDVASREGKIPVLEKTGHAYEKRRWTERHDESFSIVDFIQKYGSKAKRKSNFKNVSDIIEEEDDVGCLDRILEYFSAKKQDLRL